MNEAEAIYSFMGWLTSRKEISGPFSKRHNAAGAADLVNDFCTSQGWTVEDEGFSKQLKAYPPTAAGFKVWECKLVVSDESILPKAFDTVPREAVLSAIESKGISVIGCFSGWNGDLSEAEIAVLTEDGDGS